MNKTVTLRGFDGARTDFIIENFEDVRFIYCRIVTGDEILRVIYKSGEVCEFDCGEGRILDFIDGEYIIPLGRIDEFSAQTNSYEAMEFFKELVEEEV